MVYLIVFGSVIAYISYIWLLSIKPAPLVSTHTYINPIVAVVTGSIIANQVINQTQFYGLFIILTGVLFTNVSKYIKISKRSKVRISQSIRVYARGKLFQLNKKQFN